MNFTPLTAGGAVFHVRRCFYEKYQAPAPNPARLARSGRAAEKARARAQTACPLFPAPTPDATQRLALADARMATLHANMRRYHARAAHRVRQALASQPAGPVAAAADQWNNRPWGRGIEYLLTLLAKEGLLQPQAAA